MAMLTAEAYAMLRIHCLPGANPKQPGTPQAFHVDVPLLRKQLPLYLGRAKRGKEDSSLQEYGEHAEAIRATKANSLLMAHCRSTLSKRQFRFSWDSQQGCIVLQVCGSTAVNIDGEHIPQNSTVPLHDLATIVTAGVVIQFCPALTATPGTAAPRLPVSNATQQGLEVPMGLPAASASAQAGGEPPRKGKKRARSGAMREELEAALQQWKQDPNSQGKDFTTADMLGLVATGGEGAGEGEDGAAAATAKKRRLGRQLRDFVKKGLLIETKPGTRGASATYRVV